MVGVRMRTQKSRWILAPSIHEIQLYQDSPMSFSDTIFGFVQEQSEEHSQQSDEVSPNDYESEDEEVDITSPNVKRSGNFWKTQHQLLEATLLRRSSLETRIRNVTTKALKELQTIECSCQRSVVGSCQDCMMREVCDRLQTEGFNAAICKCKWKGSPEIFAGEHTFVDVLDDSNPKKRNVRVIIELSFRSEFELLRGTTEYNQLLSILPEVYIGKVERLVSIIKILCSAAKRCMKETKMYVAPWRKYTYMEAKWLRVSERSISKQLLLTTTSTQPFRPKSSMLTIALSENMINLHCVTTKVV